MGEKRGDKQMEEQSKGTVLMQREWKGDRNNDWSDNFHESAVTEPGGKEIKV
jgi:hypothetical protein